MKIGSSVQLLEVDSTINNYIVADISEDIVTLVNYKDKITINIEKEVLGTIQDLNKFLEGADKVEVN